VLLLCGVLFLLYFFFFAFLGGFFSFFFGTYALLGETLYMAIHRLELRFGAILFVFLCTDVAIICAMMPLYCTKGRDS